MRVQCPAVSTPGAEILPDGRSPARVPDPVADPVLTGEAFEFTQDRDMLTYATELMTAVEIFVDSVLDAFAASHHDPEAPADRHIIWTNEGWRGPGAQRGSR